MEEIIKPYGYIYLTTNLINGKGYIGKHSKPYHDPSYIGSGGRHFWNAVNLYGRENFINEVLCWCFSEEELNAEEEFLIDFFDCIESDDFYNEREGGKGGWGKGIHHTRYGKASPLRGKPRTEETKLRISRALKGKGLGRVSSMYGRHHSEESKRKMSLVHKGKLVGELNPMYGRQHSEESKQKISLAVSGENNPFYGKKHSDESKLKISESRRGAKNPGANKIWITNGTQNKRVDPELLSVYIEEGWKKGRSVSDETRRKHAESIKSRNRDSSGKFV